MTKTFGNWTLGRPLGQGGQGHVFIAYRTGEENEPEKYALKRLSRCTNEKARERFAREIDALKKSEPSRHHQASRSLR